MMFSLVKLTLFLFFAIGTQGSGSSNWNEDSSIHQRDIHVPHPRLRRAYLEKVAKPDNSEHPTEEKLKDVADKVTEDKVEYDSNVKDLNEEPIEPATTEKPKEISEVVPNEDKDNLKKEPSIEKQLRKRNTYEGIKINKPYVKTISETKVKTTTDLKPTTVEESTTSKLEVKTTSSEEATPLEEDLTEQPNDKVEESSRSKRNSYGVAKKVELKSEADKDLNEKPETPLKSKPLEETDVVESTTSEPGYKIPSVISEDLSSEKPDASETENKKAEERNKRNSYGYVKKNEIKVNIDEKLNEKPATPYKSNPSEKTPAIELTTSGSVHGVSAHISEDLSTNKPIESEEEDKLLTEEVNESDLEDKKEEERHKRNAYGYVKKTEIKVKPDEKMKDKPTTPLDSYHLEETSTNNPDADVSTSQSTLNEDTSNLESIVE